MITGRCTSAIRRLTAGILALFVAMSALAVIGASPAGAHRGPAHEHESSAGQSGGTAEPPRNQPTSSRVPPGAPTGSDQPTTQNVSPAENNLTMAVVAAVGLGGGLVTGGVVVGLGIVKAVSDGWYEGYTGPSENSDRNQPSSSRVPKNARRGR